MSRQLKSHMRYQKGIVLFVALIALVVMSLAAVALIRSVDTNTQIAGNLSFKQSALVSTDRGVETALDWLKAQAVADLASLDADSATNGYFATFTSLDLDDPAVLKANATWSNSSVPATGTGISGGVEASSGNDIRYIVQRMCTEAVTPTKAKCQLAAGEIDNNSKGNKDEPMLGGKFKSAESPIYRVTVRVTGAKNSVSYTQTFVY